MSFKHFVCAEQLKLNVDIHYPLVWNDLQTWDISLELSKATVFLVFQHKYFFQGIFFFCISKENKDKVYFLLKKKDLINDWSSKSIADLRSFVPYIYNITASVTDLEVILPSNQHNWIDTQLMENNGN